MKLVGGSKFQPKIQFCPALHREVLHQLNIHVKNKIMSKRSQVTIIVNAIFRAIRRSARYSNFTKMDIGVGDGGKGDKCPPKFSKKYVMWSIIILQIRLWCWKYACSWDSIESKREVKLKCGHIKFRHFSSKYHVKFQNFVNILGKYHKNLRISIIFRANIMQNSGIL